MRWLRWAALLLAAAAIGCAVVAVVQWYARNYGTDDLVCRSRDQGVRGQPNCVDTRADPRLMLAVAVALAAAAALAWLRARRRPTVPPARRTSSTSV